MSHHLTRRGLGLAALGALGAVASACGSSSSGSSSGGGQLVVATYGGAMGNALKTAFFDPFTKETGIAVVQATADVGRFVSMNERGKSDWDTMDSDGFSMPHWAELKVVEKLGADVPRADLIPAVGAEYAGGAYTVSFNLVYRKDAFSRAPENWVDFFDTKTFPGKRGYPNYFGCTLEPALLADGVAPDQLYPLDLDRGFAKLTELRSSLTVYESYSAIVQGLQARSVDMAILPNGRAASAVKSDPGLAIQWNQNFQQWAGFPVAVGGGNKEKLNQLFTYMADPVRQATYAEASNYGPSLKAAFDHVSAETLQYLPATPEHAAVAIHVSDDAMASQGDEYLKRYSDWLAG